MASRPSQGDNSAARKPPRAAYKSDSTPKVVSLGSLSKPAKRAQWRPGLMAPDATPKVVQR
jgi:hypothetical protein